MSLNRYVVELSDSERQICREVVTKLKVTRQKVKRATPPVKKFLSGE